MFLAPASLREIDGEPIEQFEVIRHGSSSAEVFGSRYDPLAKESLPDAVDLNSSGERGVFIRSPVSEVEAGRVFDWQWVEYCGDLSLDGVRGAIPGTALEEAGYTGEFGIGLGRV